MIEMGILPASSRNELRNMMLTLSQDDQIKSKRKFRKMWKRALKRNPEFEHLMVPENNGKVTSYYTSNRLSIVCLDINKKLETS
tara:strand:- start:8030 stop:8281 length:252 start_codon:yes stop_codon:yes gene_type:complete